MDRVHVVDHPLVRHKLALLRDQKTSTSEFRALLEEISMLIGYELTRDLPTTPRRVETPLASCECDVIDGKKIVLVPILRAGLGMLEGMLRIVPAARVGHVGLYRDPLTLEPVEYYFKVPGGMAERDVIVLDPMLATGHSAIAAVRRVVEAGARTVKYACVLASPDGLDALSTAYPELPIWTGSIDTRLDANGYIVPGLGDAGDRLYGTR